MKDTSPSAIDGEKFEYVNMLLFQLFHLQFKPIAFPMHTSQSARSYANVPTDFVDCGRCLSFICHSASRIVTYTGKLSI